jgi:preprotein translocase SecE subunit
MARNRKRAKERRDRRPQTVGIRASLSGSANGPSAEELPGPLEHAAPDAELAEAQLAVGRGELIDDEFEFQDEPAASGDGVGGGGVSVGTGFDGEDGGEPPSGGEIALPTPGAIPEPRVRPHNRLIAFLEGSWRELQRVQWPDRRQVMQATAVVLGFVIVAGLVLAVADTLASHLMSYILTGTHSVLAWVAVAVIVLSLAGWMLADRDR